MEYKLKDFFIFQTKPEIKIAWIWIIIFLIIIGFLLRWGMFIFDKLMR